MFCLIFLFPFYFFFYIVDFLISDVDSIVICDVFSRGRRLALVKYSMQLLEVGYPFNNF